VIATYRGQVGRHARGYGSIKPFLAIFRAENDMDNDLAERLGQSVIKILKFRYETGRWPSMKIRSFSQGVALDGMSEAFGLAPPEPAQMSKLQSAEHKSALQGSVPMRPRVDRKTCCGFRRFA